MYIYITFAKIDNNIITTYLPDTKELKEYDVSDSDRKEYITVFYKSSYKKIHIIGNASRLLDGESKIIPVIYYPRFTTIIVESNYKKFNNLINVENIEHYYHKIQVASLDEVFLDNNIKKLINSLYTLDELSKIFSKMEKSLHNINLLKSSIKNNINISKLSKDYLEVNKEITNLESITNEKIHFIQSRLKTMGNYIISETNDKLINNYYEDFNKELENAQSLLKNIRIK